MCDVCLENGVRVVRYRTCIGSELHNQMFQLKYSVTNAFQQRPKELFFFCLAANDQKVFHMVTIRKSSMGTNHLNIPLLTFPTIYFLIIIY